MPAAPVGLGSPLPVMREVLIGLAIHIGPIKIFPRPPVVLGEGRPFQDASLRREAGLRTGPPVSRRIVTGPLSRLVGILDTDTGTARPDVLLKVCRLPSFLGVVGTVPVMPQTAVDNENPAAFLVGIGRLRENIPACRPESLCGLPVGEVVNTVIGGTGHPSLAPDGTPLTLRPPYPCPCSIVTGVWWIVLSVTDGENIRQGARPDDAMDALQVRPRHTFPAVLALLGQVAALRPWLTVPHDIDGLNIGVPYVPDEVGVLAPVSKYVRPRLSVSPRPPRPVLPAATQDSRGVVGLPRGHRPSAKSLALPCLCRPSGLSPLTTLQKFGHVPIPFSVGLACRQIL